MQTLETLMLRLTTNVTMSPASSARSASAAWRMSSTTSGRVSENSAVSSSAVSALAVAGALDRAGATWPSRRRGTNDGWRARITSSTRGDCQSRRCTAGTRTAARRARRRRRPAARAPARGDGNGCSGEMWSPLALSPPRSVAPARTSSGHQSARFGGIWMPTSGISRRASAISRFMSAIVTSFAHAGRSCSGASPIPVRQ